jgi:hypothetical protein
VYNGFFSLPSAATAGAAFAALAPAFAPKIDPNDANIPFGAASLSVAVALAPIAPVVAAASAVAPLCTARANALSFTRSSATSAFRYSAVFASVRTAAPFSYASITSACRPPAFASRRDVVNRLRSVVDAGDATARDDDDDADADDVARASCVAHRAPPRLIARLAISRSIASRTRGRAPTTGASSSSIFHRAA